MPSIPGQLKPSSLGRYDPALTIEEYEKAEIDGLFMEQQQYQLQKLYDMFAELEAKVERLLKRLHR